MKKEEVRKIVKYWYLTAEHDYKTMLGLFGIKRYSDSLFYGHIILEKILKGLVVKQTKKEAPYTHDLIRLEKIAKLGLNEENLDLLDRVNSFNIRTRYPEQRLRFYKLCTREYTKDYFEKIIKLYKELCQRLMPKK